MINGKDDSLADITSGSDRLLDSLDKLDLASGLPNAARQASKQQSLLEKPLFHNIRTGTASRLWQGFNWEYMQYALFGYCILFTIIAIRGDGWGPAVSTLVVTAVAAWFLPSSINKKRRPPQLFFRWSPRPRENSTLNMIAYFFVASYMLAIVISVVSASSGGHIEFNYTLLPLAIAIPSAIAYWNSSNSSWIKRTIGSICCPVVVFASVLLFYLGADGSASMQNLEGLSYYRDANFKESLEPFSKAIEINPLSPKYLVNRGWSYYYLKNKDRSARDAKSALRIDPNNADALKLLEALSKGKD